MTLSLTAYLNERFQFTYNVSNFASIYSNLAEAVWIFQIRPMAGSPVITLDFRTGGSPQNANATVAFLAGPPAQVVVRCPASLLIGVATLTYSAELGFTLPGADYERVDGGTIAFLAGVVVPPAAGTPAAPTGADDTVIGGANPTPAATVTLDATVTAAINAAVAAAIGFGSAGQLALYSPTPHVLQGSGAIALGAALVGPSGVLFSGAFVTPEMFEAGGLGLTDDTIPLQGAINSGKMALLAGEYMITAQVGATIAINQAVSMFGVGGQSKIILGSASATLNFAIADANSYDGQCGSLLLRDFKVVIDCPVGDSIGSAVGTIVGAINVKMTGIAGAPGAGVRSCVIDNVSLYTASATYGQKFAFVGLFLQDMNDCYINFSAAADAVLGSQSACVVHKTSLSGSSPNVPTAIYFEKCTLLGGCFGVQFHASGGTGVNQDPQGVFVLDSLIIGQSVRSIDMAATDQDNVEWRVQGCSLGTAKFNGCGGIRFVGNTVITSNLDPQYLTVGDRYTIITAGSTSWTSLGSPNNTVGTTFTATAAAPGGTGGVACPPGLVLMSSNDFFLPGIVTNNVFDGTGAESVAIDATLYDVETAGLGGNCLVVNNISLNSGGGYLLTGGSLNGVVNGGNNI
jgi:hypothetical protein